MISQNGANTEAKAQLIQTQPASNRCAIAAVPLVGDDPELRHRARELLGQPSCPVDAPVVDDDDLVGDGKRAPGQAGGAHAGHQVVDLVVTGQDDRQAREQGDAEGRFVDELSHHVDHVQHVEVVAGQHGLRGRQIAASGEDRQPVERTTFSRFQ